MSLRRYLEKFRYIDSLIRKKGTGNQKRFATKVGISVSTLNEYLNEMKDTGFPIKFCHKTRTYYYDKSGQMVESLFSEEVTKEESGQVSGGFACFYTNTFSITMPFG